MKFLTLGLKSFGCFSNMDLDFQGSGNLHLILGPNEAGKSTTLRAIRGFLFGIPVRSEDVHTHEGKHLRVVATLVGADGSNLALARRKGNKNDLLFTDESVADEALLHQLLGGVEIDYFNAMFGLTHTDLVDGGQSLLEQDGSLGEALFGAGTGSGMRSVLASLGAEAKEVFKKTGKNQPLNQAIAAFKVAKKDAKNTSLKPKEWKRVAEALADAEARLAVLGEERAALRIEEQKLTRLKFVIPALVAIRGYRENLSELPEVPRMHASAASERKDAESRLRELDTRKTKLVGERARNLAKSESISVPKSMLDRKQELESLAGELGAHKKALGDLPGLRSRAEIGLKEIEATLRGLGKESHIGNIEELRVTEQAQAKLRDLANAKGGLEKHFEQASKAVRVAKTKLDELEATRALLPMAQDAAALALLAKEIQKLGDPEQTVRDLARDIASDERDVGRLLTSLGRFEGDAEDCCKLALPGAETVEEYRASLERSMSDFRTSTAEEHKLKDRQAEGASAIEALQAGGVVHTLAQLNDVRRSRDANWSEVRECWLEGGEVGSGSASNLAATLSTSIGKADQVADNLRDDAERTGRLVALEAELQRATGHLERQRARSKALTVEQEALRASWNKLWEPVDIATGTPIEMRGWLVKHEKLVAAVATLGDMRRDLEGLAASINTQRTLLSTELQSLGEPAAKSEESLLLLLERAAAICDGIAANTRRCEQWQSDLDEAKELEAVAAADLPTAEQALESWRASWIESVKLMGLPGDASVSEMEAVLRGLSAVFDKLNTVGQSQGRINHIEQDVSEFSGKVATLVTACAPHLTGRPPAEAAAALGESLIEAVRADDDRRRLSEREQEIEIELADTEIEVISQQAVLNGLMEQAGVAEVVMLAAVEEESDRQRALYDKLDDSEQSLHGVGVPVDELELEAKDVAIDSLAGSIEAAAASLEEVDETIRKQHDEVAGLRQEFDSMDASSAASKAAEDAQTALADIRSHTAIYARLILAEHILGAEIDRYRKENQGPVLERAGEMFRRMTLDSFAGLGTEFDSKDEPMLVCRRDSGDIVEVSGLSDGTRDQLFLALRLASLELHAKNNEPLPLIMDDLLINFDDERAGATLKLIAEVAETTQILFFSHHTHLVEIARGAVPKEMWQEHRLVDA